MPRYMNQELFNVLAVTLGWADRLNIGDVAAKHRLLEQMLGNYRRAFPTDGFEPELVRAANAFRDWLVATYPQEPEQSHWFDNFRYAVEHFKPDGTLKPKRLFNGHWFRSPSSAPPDRYSQFIKDTGLYFLNMQSGLITGGVVAKRELRWGLLVSLPLALLAGFEAARHHRTSISIGIYVLALCILRLVDIWATRRKWKRWKRLLLNVALALLLQAIVWASSVEVYEVDTGRWKRVFF